MGRPVQNVNPAPSIAAGALKLRTVSPSARSLAAQCGALLYLQGKRPSLPVGLDRVPYRRGSLSERCNADAARAREALRAAVRSEVTVAARRLRTSPGMQRVILRVLL